jgi:branched-chain amino acid transport system substrate-binding protein
MKKYFVVLLLALIALSCSKKEETIKIGAILPLTGSAAELAGQHKQGLESAISELNNSRGDKIKYELVLDDDQNDPKNTVNLLQKQLNVDKIRAVITVTSSPSLAIAPIADKNNIPLFANCGHPTITSQYKSVFRNFPSSAQEIIRMSKFVSGTLKVNKIFFLYIDDAFGKGAEKVVLSEFPAVGIDIVGTEAYGKEATDVRTIIVKAVSKHSGAIYVYGYGMPTAQIVNKLRETGYKGIILGSYNFSQPPLTTISASSIEGSYYTVPTFQKAGKNIAAEFWNTFEKKYNTPPLWNMVVEYDAIMILDKAIQLEKGKNISLIEALNQIGNYSGIGGNYIFQNTKDWLLPMSIATVKSGQVDYIE